MWGLFILKITPVYIFIFFTSLIALPHSFISSRHLLTTLYLHPLTDSLCAEACCCCSVHRSPGPPCAGRVQPVFRLVWLQNTPASPVSQPTGAIGARLRVAPVAVQLPAQWPWPVEHRGRLRVYLLPARWVLPHPYPVITRPCRAVV